MLPRLPDVQHTEARAKQRTGRSSSLGRRAVWRRGQARRALAALCAAGAVWVVVTALRPVPPELGEPVLVAAADLPAGTVLEAGHVRVARVPEAVLPSGALHEPSAVMGSVSSGPLRTREVLTDRDLMTGSLAQGLGPDVVVAHVALRDEALAAAVGPGNRVDVLSVLDGTTLAADVPVLATDPDGTSGVFVAVSAAQASALARQSGSEMVQGVTLVLRPAKVPGSG